MPKKYLVEMADGRKFQVEADSQPSEEEVLAHLSAQEQPYTPDSPLLHHPNEQEGPAPAPGWKDKLGALMEPMAHPQTGADMAGLLLQTGHNGAVAERIVQPIGRIIGKYGGAAVDLGKSLLPQSAQKAVTTLRGLNPASWNSPLTVAGREARALASSAGEVAQGAEQYTMPAARNVNSGTVPDRGIPQGEMPLPTPAAASAPAAQAMSDAERAALVKQGYSPETIAKIEQQAGSAMPIQGTLRMAPKTNPPITVDPASLPQSWRDLPHPLDPSRVEIGAEKTGRAAGMTKQEVRDVATPILGVEPGAASPILPEGALKRIIDALKELPPGSPEREAYVAKATAGKTQWQVENIRRTLEHLGLIVPVAATGGALFRDALVKRLNPNGGPY